jgi:methyl-accepting chemotaxis protein
VCSSDLGLAGQSKVAAGSAITLVKGIKEAGNQTSTITQQSQVGAAEGASVVLSAIKESEGISKIMGEMTGKVNNLASGVERGLDALSVVVRTIEEVASIAEESSSAAEEESSAIEEQTASSQEMAAIAKDVSTTAENVSKETQKMVTEAQEMAKLAWSVTDNAATVDTSAKEIFAEAEKVGQAVGTAMTEATTMAEISEQMKSEVEQVIEQRKQWLSDFLANHGEGSEAN